VLQYYGKVPVKFVVFPGEPHGPRKLTHQMRKVEEEQTWFAKYFFKNEKPEDEALKKDSPLSAEIKRVGVSQVGGNYGVTKASAALLPETVDHDGVQIGRFEVTRAQWAAYEKKAASSAEKANFPASAITLDQAQAYVKWLSKTTGETWRIPYEDEMTSLYENRSGENTLDYWAGYAPNPEDTAKLREAAKKLNGTAPLLKEVGSFAGHGKEGEEPIYDLGGNVAEWVLTRDGKGKVIGGSADCPASAESGCTPAPEYVGFRVVRGEAKPESASEKH
jgi:formylglycine-generating enzyme required for sulfatase activity